MPSIEAFAHVTPNDLPPISINDYNAIVHLAWVQPFTDHIKQYRESPNIAPTLIHDELRVRKEIAQRCSV